MDQIAPQNNNGNPAPRQILALAHGLAHAAMIQLHNASDARTAAAGAGVSDAAQHHADEVATILGGIIDGSDMEFISPVFSVRIIVFFPLLLRIVF